MRKGLKSLKRIVIKIGSSSITHENGKINLGKIADLSWQIANLKNLGYEVILVSSGAIPAGAGALGKPIPKTPQKRQAASAVGQVALMHAYNSSLKQYNYNAAQMLLTKQIETDVVMRENASNAFDEILKLDCIPIINENDAISTFEIEFGDNDTLSAIIARLIKADLLIILSDVNGLYNSDPNINSDAKLISDVLELSKEHFDCATGVTSNRGTGGMRTKLNAASLCMERGIDMLLANGGNMNIIREIFEEDTETGTLFHGKENHNA